MTHSLNSRVATKPALDVRTYPPRRTISPKPGRRELESKLAELQRDYAELAGRGSATSREAFPETR